MKYIPFTNGTQAMYWDETNCAKCRRRPCAARTALHACREITPHCVVLVGASTHVQGKLAFATMPTRCASFTTLPVPRRRPAIGKNTPGLFGGGVGHEPI